MGAGRKIYRIGFLMMKKIAVIVFVVKIFLLFPFILSAEGENAENIALPPVVTISVYPQTFVTGDHLRLTLFANHPFPDEVFLIAPPFPPALHLHRYVKSPRMTASGIQTVFEFTLVPNRSGRILIEPFTVITPVGTTQTGYLVLDVQAQNIYPARIFPQIIWETEAGLPLTFMQMTKGERIVFVLRVTGAALGYLPLRDFFMPEVPQGAILTSLSLSEQERAAGIVLKLSLIPLEGNFRLPARTLNFNNFVFEIPALHISVTERRIVFPEDVLPKDTDNISETVFPFPDFDYSFFDNFVMNPWLAQSAEIYRQAKSLWESGFYAQALAELRGYERDHPASVFFRLLRQEAEETLGFYFTEHENRWQRILLFVLSILVLFLVIIFPFVCLLFFGGLRKKLAVICAVVIAIFGSISLYWLVLYRLADTTFILQHTSGRFQSLGVTVETPVRRLADINGEKLFFFREGQPVVIMLNSGLWVYVRTNDAERRTGWIPAENVIFY